MAKTAIITGGSRGIGKAVVYALAEDGFIPVINYVKNREMAEKTASETGGIAFMADVSDSGQVMQMIKEIHDRTGQIDVLVNNAGISVSGLFTDITPQQAQRLWDINVQGVFNCTKAVLPHMIHRKYGRIINISSMWGQVGASCEVPVTVKTLCRNCVMKHRSEEQESRKILHRRFRFLPPEKVIL